MKTCIHHTPSSRWLGWALRILLLAALIAAAMPAAKQVSAKSTTKCEKNYEVRRGDTLQTIGNRYGYAPNQIVVANNWKSPYTIYVGQKYCLPTSKANDAPKLESKQLNAPAVYFTAGRSGDYILVYTYNYPKTATQVKVGKANSVGKQLTNVGSINVANSGNGKSWRFNLPNNLKNTANLTVCLKDRTTSYLQCVVPRSGS
jgi:hypothetical protein